MLLQCGEKGVALDQLHAPIVRREKHLNLGLVELPPGEQARRLRVLTAAYGIPADRDVIAAVERVQNA